MSHLVMQGMLWDSNEETFSINHELQQLQHYHWVQFLYLNDWNFFWFFFVFIDSRLLQINQQSYNYRNELNVTHNIWNTCLCMVCMWYLDSVYRWKYQFTIRFNVDLIFTLFSFCFQFVVHHFKCSTPVKLI